MSDYSTQVSTTTGEKAMISVNEEKTTVIGVDAGVDDRYDIEVQFNSSGARFPVKRNNNGKTTMTLPYPADRVGIEILEIPSGSITLEVFTEIDISQSIATEG